MNNTALETLAQPTAAKPNTAIVLAVRLRIGF
jgi:hypothetical protein